MPVYGHRQFSFFFFPLVEMRDTGFVFRRRWYTWRDVSGVTLWEQEWRPRHVMRLRAGELVPQGLIHLSDGRYIRINGRAFEKQGAPRGAGHVTAFNEFIDFIQTRVRQHRAFQARKYARH